MVEMVKSFVEEIKVLGDAFFQVVVY